MRQFMRHFLLEFTKKLNEGPIRFFLIVSHNVSQKVSQK